MGDVATHLEGLCDLLDGEIERDRTATARDYTLLRLARSIQADAEAAFAKLDRLWLDTSPLRARCPAAVQAPPGTA
jgi:hypothetical protein